MRTSAKYLLLSAPLFGGLLALCPASAHAQGGVPLWTNIYQGGVHGSETSAALAVDSNGNVFVIANGDATIAYSNSGVPLWTNRYDGDSLTSIAVDNSGNVFVTGWPAAYDYATIKYSGAGVPLWTNRYNGTGNSVDQAFAIAVDSSGNVFVTGGSVGTGTSFDYLTIKYSGAGLPLWTNRYNGPGNSSDNSTDIARAMAVDSSGNVFVTGYSSAANGLLNYATVKYSNAGVPLWTNR